MWDFGNTDSATNGIQSNVGKRQDLALGFVVNYSPLDYLSVARLEKSLKAKRPPN